MAGMKRGFFIIYNMSTENEHREVKDPLKTAGLTDISGAILQRVEMETGESEVQILHTLNTYEGYSEAENHKYSYQTLVEESALRLNDNHLTEPQLVKTLTDIQGSLQAIGTQEKLSDVHAALGVGLGLLSFQLQEHRLQLALRRTQSESITKAISTHVPGLY